MYNNIYSNTFSNGYEIIKWYGNGECIKLSENKYTGIIAIH